MASGCCLRIWGIDSSYETWGTYDGFEAGQGHSCICFGKVMLSGGVSFLGSSDLLCALPGAHFWIVAGPRGAVPCPMQCCCIGHSWLRWSRCLCKAVLVWLTRSPGGWGWWGWPDARALPIGTQHGLVAVQCKQLSLRGFKLIRAGTVINWWHGRTKKLEENQSHGKETQRIAIGCPELHWTATVALQIIQ